MNKKGLTFSVLLISMLPCIARGAAQAEDYTTIQGIEKIDDVAGMLQVLAEKITEQDTEHISDQAQGVRGSWQAFVEHHAAVFSGEISPSEELKNAIAVITDEIDAVVDRIDDTDLTETLTIIDGALAFLDTLREKVAKPVLLDFTGSVCKACKIMKPRLERVAPGYAERVRIVFVDVNTQKSMTREYKVMLIPTFVFIDSAGEERARYVGEMEERVIRQNLDKLLKE